MALTIMLPDFGLPTFFFFFSFLFFPTQINKQSTPTPHPCDDLTLSAPIYLLQQSWATRPRCTGDISQASLLE